MKRWSLWIGLPIAIAIAAEAIGHAAVHWNAAGALLGMGRPAAALLAFAWLALRVMGAVAFCGLMARIAMVVFDALVRPRVAWDKLRGWLRSASAPSAGEKVR